MGRIVGMFATGAEKRKTVGAVGGRGSSRMEDIENMIVSGSSQAISVETGREMGASEPFIGQMEVVKQDGRPQQSSAKMGSGYIALGLRDKRKDPKPMPLFFDA
jgi:hypothetical protein